MDVHVLPDPGAVADEAARQVMALAAAAIAARGRFVVALSGGTTPRAMHERIAATHRSALDWTRVEFYWSDDRLVPPDHPDSNYRMARETLIDPLGIAPARVHRIRGEDADPRVAAEAYARDIARSVQVEGSLPAFDLVLLGMGADGHTASLFPFSEALDVEDRWVVPTRAPRPPVDRITLTFPVILAARAVRVIVTGADKAATLAEVLHGPDDSCRLPAQRLASARGDLRWLADAASIRTRRGQPAGAARGSS